MTARWDGKGVPADVAGEQISRPLRIVHVAHDFVAVARARDRAAALEALGRRRGRGYDPRIVDVALAEPEALLRAADAPDGFGRVLDAEPKPVATISSAGAEVVARAFGEFVDIKLAFLTGHSGRVAELGGRRRGARLLARRDLGSPVRGLLARPRPGGGAERGLGQARRVECRRARTRSPSPLIDRARA